MLFTGEYAAPDESDANRGGHTRLHGSTRVIQCVQKKDKVPIGTRSRASMTYALINWHHT